MPSKSIRTAESRRKSYVYIGIGAIALVILLVTLAAAGQQQSFRCDRLATGEVDCKVIDSILGLIVLKEKTIPGAQAISIGQQCVDVNCNYRLEVYATQGLIPVREKYTANYDQLVELKNQLNQFFSDKTRNFVAMKEETNPLLIGGVVAVVIVIWAFLGYLIWLAYHPTEEA
jgi:hypothetical protein